jgi:hypothetical protein
MKGDFSRTTFAPGKHYSGVHMQQGRVQLDADWNENLDLLRHRIETEAADVIGASGVPVHAAAFGVITKDADLSDAEKAWLTDQGIAPTGASDFYLTQGRAYVDGILVENEHTIPVSQQPSVLPKGKVPVSLPGVYVLYLDVWERLITALEDPDIREVALGGPDTAARTQVIWQAVLARVGEVGESITCSDKLAPWPEASRGKLSARAHAEEKPSSPCVVPPGAGYTRLENQLYRVEIHAGTAEGTPTFKWSRDNGSIAVPIVDFSVDGNDTKIRTAGLGRDGELGLRELDWVEVSDDASELAGRPGTLARIDRIDAGNILTLSVSISGYNADLHAKVRRWDSAGELTVTVPADNDGYIPLEAGVEIKFAIDTFRTGDYWLIPARTVPGQYGDVEWPKDGDNNPLAQLPFGIQHHYCRLAVLSVQMTDEQTHVTVIDDCRRQFPPLTELPAGASPCVSVTVGQAGDYTDLAAAIQARPSGATWWTVFVLPGIVNLRTTVTIDGAHNLTIRGCGGNSRLIAAPGQSALQVSKSQAVTFEQLSIEAAAQDQAVLAASDSTALTVANCSIANAYSGPATTKKGDAVEFGPLLMVDRCDGVEIVDNWLRGKPAVQANGTSLGIRRNNIKGGGVQIIPPSATVAIENNSIVGGRGPGIQLGGGTKTAADFYAFQERTMPVGKASSAAAKLTSPSETVRPALKAPTMRLLAGIRDVDISENLIGAMEGSGIVTETSLSEAASLGDIENLRIMENAIVGCCLVPDVILLRDIAVGGGIAAVGLFGAQIAGNFIADSGARKHAACGILVIDGSHIDVAGNTVVENGIDGSSPPANAFQAGIAVEHVLGNYLEGVPVPGQQVPGARSGYPAARIRDNRVVCPAGPALVVSAMGTIAVEGNTFSTRDLMPAPVDPATGGPAATDGTKGACVRVVNLGMPVWLPEFALAMQLIATGALTFHLEDYANIDALMAEYPDGRVLFHDNQVTFHSARQEAVDSLGPVDSTFFERAWKQATLSAVFYSLDDISLSGNQFQATVPLYAGEGLKKWLENPKLFEQYLAYFLKFIDVASAASIIRSVGNGFAERLLSNSYSYISFAALLNVTIGNEATHDFITVGRNTKDPDNPKLSEIIP